MTYSFQSGNPIESAREAIRNIKIVKKKTRKEEPFNQTYSSIRPPKLDGIPNTKTRDLDSIRRQLRGEL